jgi:hypothetical protein
MSGHEVSEPSTRHPAALDVLADDTNELQLKCTKCIFTTADLEVFGNHWNAWHTKPISRSIRAKAVMAVIYEEREKGIIGYPQRAADRLNALGIPREQGGVWDIDGVAKYYGGWRDIIMRPRRKAERTGPSPAATQPTLPEWNFQQLAHNDERNHWETLRDTVLVLRDVTDRLENIGLAVVKTQLEDTEVREKARKWDELQNLMGS